MVNGLRVTQPLRKEHYLINLRFQDQTSPCIPAWLSKSQRTGQAARGCSLQHLQHKFTASTTVMPAAALQTQNALLQLQLTLCVLVVMQLAPF
jgi:hypothetical protein